MRKPSQTTATLRGNTIKAALKAKKLRQRDLADQCDVSLRQINRIVLGVSQPSLMLAEQIRSILGDDVFTIQVVGPPKPKLRRRKSAALAQPA